MMNFLDLLWTTLSQVLGMTTRAINTADALLETAESEAIAFRDLQALSRDDRVARRKAQIELNIAAHTE